MSKRKQHPLILAMNKFDLLLTTLDSSNAEAFMAYVRNKVNARGPKSPARSAGKRLPLNIRASKSAQSSETEKETVTHAAAGD